MASQENEVPPPLRDIPTAKEKKYDRQLRLWGAAGQIALEETHILLINNASGVTGVETLKNLVLPGIGQFTILDSGIVSEADLGVNFFLENPSLGKFRAQETVKYLQELNPDVKGHAISEPIESWIQNDPEFSTFTLVLVAAPLDSAVLKTIESKVRNLHIPTFYIHCVGYYSHFSVLLPSAFPIVDTHPDPSAITDLRLLKPWPALTAFSQRKTMNMGSMNNEELGHIPYVCLLLHYLEKWKAKNSGAVPDSYEEKTAFRDLVRSGNVDEENFDEADAAVLKSLNPPTPSSSVREILNSPEAQSLTASSPPFWIIANAIQQFYTQHGELPLPGAVPDMKAHSDTYIELQNIYKQKAREDCAEVIKSVRKLEKTLNRSPKQTIDEKEIENFCKGAAHVSLVRGKPFKILEPGIPITFSDRAKALAMDLTNPESLIAIYIAFLAWDEYVATHATTAHDQGGQGLQVPGAEGSDVDSDTEKLTGIAHVILDALIKEAGTFVKEPDYSLIRTKVAKTCTELTRAAGVELHNIASLTGGLVAQEVIKVITKQYIPIDNTCVFDGIVSRSYVLRV